MSGTYAVYLMASISRVLYVGVTNDLERRVMEHKLGTTPGFTKQYRVDRLVWFDVTPDVRSAIEVEKRIKGWKREKKIALIEENNPQWRDLSLDWTG
ncbi:MAG: GIY-YIG nuclease family protein [Betaproteobacteria bacterium]|nr:GIY-YIG nuclease family protein [Betaproteobacteria bacterium]